MTVEELYKPSETVAPPQVSLSAVSSMNAISEPSDTYLAPQFQETFQQVATMLEVSRTSEQTLVRISPSQHTYRSLSSSGRATPAVARTGSTRSETTLNSRVVDTRKDLAVRNFFVQVVADHPRACFNGMSNTLGAIHRAIPSKIVI